MLKKEIEESKEANLIAKREADQKIKILLKKVKFLKKKEAYHEAQEKEFKGQLAKFVNYFASLKSELADDDIHLKETHKE